MAETVAELVLDIGDRLVGLVTPEIPVVLSNTVPPERRDLQAVLIKTVSIMRGLLDLTRHGYNTEAMVLARSLADQVITFAWLAIDPPANYSRWVKDDARERLKANKRFEKRGRTLLEPAHKARFERLEANKEVKFPPDVAGRADKADEHWAAPLGFGDDGKPFGDTYDVIFKHCSSRTHASVQGLNDVLEPTPTHTELVLEHDSDYMAGVLRASLVVFGLGLMVAAKIFTTPTSDRVDQLAAEYRRRLEAILSEGG
jgi:hypothetical protein